MGSSRNRLRYFQERIIYRNNFMLGDIFLGHDGIGQALRVAVELATKKFWWFLRLLKPMQRFILEINKHGELGDKQTWRKEADTFGVVNRKNLQKLFQGHDPKEVYHWRPICSNERDQKNDPSCRFAPSNLLLPELQKIGSHA